MIRVFLICIMAGGTVAGCKDVVGGDFCKIYDAIVTGKLKLTQAEVDALRSMTKRDIAALKLHYRRHCTEEGDKR